MSDRLYQNLIGSPVAELTDDIAADVIADEISSTIRALGRAAEDRPLPVSLDWADLRVEVRTGPHGSNRNLFVTASAPVR